MNGNDFVKIMLKSPLRGLMGNTMIITLTGRRTGRKIAVPVNYYRDADALWVITTRSRNWWRNTRGGADVDLHLHGKKLKGFAEPVLDEFVIAAHIAEYVRHLPMTANALGVHVENGMPNSNDVNRLAKERLFLKICLES